MKKTLFFILFSLTFLASRSQLPSTRGTEFWISFMENATGTGMTLSLHFSAFQNSVVTITNPNSSYSQTINVAANSLISYTVPASECYNTGSGNIANKVLKITATKDITMYALSHIQYSADGTVVLPIQALGMNYRIISYTGILNSGLLYPAEFCIVATRDSTLVKIIPSVNTLDNKVKNVPYYINLNKGQSYQVQAKTDSSLTGSVVEVQNCKAIAVFGGNVTTRVPSGCQAADHLYEQLYPTSMWGKEYVLVPTASRSQDRYIILADQSSTGLTINGTATTIVNAGDTYEADLNVPVYISSNKPVCIAIYAQGQGCGGGNGDPMMMWATPVEQNIDSIIFVAQSSSIVNNHYVNIIAKTNTVASIKLNGINIGSSFTTVAANTAYSYARKSINPGANRITSDSGFTAYAYGYGNAESYGYSVGSSIRNLNWFFTVNNIINDNFSTPATALVFCNSTVVFKGNASFTPLYWRWKFNNDSANTQTVTKTFPDTGLVKVMLLTNRGGTNSCSGSDTAFQYIRIVGHEIHIFTADTAICQGGSFKVRVAITGDSTVVWNASPDLSCTNCKEPIISPSSTPSWYKVRLGVPALGCSVTDSIYVQLIDRNSLTISRDTTICAGQKARIKASLAKADSVTKYTYQLFGNNNFIKQDTVSYFEINLDTTTTFVIKAISGCYDTLSPAFTVFVRRPLKIQFLDSVLICQNKPGNFNFQLSGGDSSYAVYLLENNLIIDSVKNAIIKTNYNFSFVPDQSKIYTLVFTDGCTLKNDTQAIPLKQRMPLGFTHSPDPNICSGQMIALNVKPYGGDSSYTIYLLRNQNLLDSITNASFGNSYFFTLTPVINTVYKIVLTDGCTLINDTQTFTVNGRNPLSSWHSPNQLICIGQSYKIQIRPYGGDSSYTIYLVNNTVPVDSIINAAMGNNYYFTVTPLTNTKYTLVIKDGCTPLNDSENIDIMVKDFVKLTIGRDTIICKDQNFAIWVSPSGCDTVYTLYLMQGNLMLDSIVNAKSDSSYKFIVSPGVQARYKILLRNKYTKLEDSAFFNLDVYPPLSVKAMASPVKICYSDSVLLSATASGGNTTYSYLWNRGAGNYASVKIMPKASGWYLMKADDGCSATAYDSVYIEVMSLPAVNFSALNTSGCEPFTVQFKNNNTLPNAGYLWEFGDGTTDTSANAIHTYALAGSYNVKLIISASSGCIDSLVRNNYIVVHSNPQITLTIDPKKVKVNNGRISFITTNTFTDNYDFYFGDSKSILNQPKSNKIFGHIYTDTGYFIVRLVAHNNFGCTAEFSDSVFIGFNYPVFIPNAFSPGNKDGHNDFFKPAATQYEMVIYDRWGQVMYTEKCMDKDFNCNGWDGTYNGRPVQQDAYIYLITLFDSDMIMSYERGTVVVVR